MVAKGAPQKLYEIDGDSQPQSVIDQVEGAIEAFAQKGYFSHCYVNTYKFVVGRWRPLGVARKMLKTNNKDSSPWEYVGVMALYDPPRHDTKETIEASLELGVDVKMVTGDHLLVAKETARQLGLGTKIHGPEDFKKAQVMPQA